MHVLPEIRTAGRIESAGKNDEARRGRKANRRWPAATSG
jgi:hypothetical protein